MSWYDLPSFLSHLCLPPTPSPSPSDSIRPHLPAFHHLRSNSAVYSCNYAMSALGLASDYHCTYLDLIPVPRGTVYILPIICLILSSLSITGNCFLFNSFLHVTCPLYRAGLE